MVSPFWYVAVASVCLRALGVRHGKTERIWGGSDCRATTDVRHMFLVCALCAWHGNQHLCQKQVRAKDFFGSHLRLGGHHVVVSPLVSGSVEPLTQWAALRAAHAEVGQRPHRSILVRRRGFEPPRACAHYHLKVARLPIPPPAHVGLDNTELCGICPQKQPLARLSYSFFFSGFSTGSSFCS